MKEEASIQSHEASPPVSQHQNVCAHRFRSVTQYKIMFNFILNNQFLSCDCDCCAGLFLVFRWQQ